MNLKLKAKILLGTFVISGLLTSAPNIFATHTSPTNKIKSKSSSHSYHPQCSSSERVNINWNEELFKAIRNKSVFQALRCLKNGANPNAIGNDRQTPLHMAAKRNSLLFTDMLLRHGANPNVTDNYDKTPLHYASERNNLNIAARLINKSPEIIDCQDINGDTSLLIFIGKNNLDAVYFLLSNNADPNIPDTNRTTPLHCATNNNNLQITSILLQSGANVNVADSTGVTPLHHAAFNLNWPVISLLLYYGANQTISDNYGVRPFDYLQPTPPAFPSTSLICPVPAA